MNSRAPIYVVLPLAGFAFGWWAKGRGPESQPAPIERREIPASGPQALTAEGKTLQPTKRPRPEEDEETPEEQRRREDADRSYALTRSRKVMEVQLARWVRELSLDKNQAARLQASIDGIIKTQEGSEEPPSPAVDELEAELLELLDEDKAGELEELDKRREEAVTSARASSKLAEMQSILALAPEDQEKLYEHLLSGAGDLPAPGRIPAAGMNPAMMVEVTARVNARGGDSDTFLQVAREVAKEQIEKEVTGLSGMLAPDQLETWRMHLEDENARWLLGDP